MSSRRAANAAIAAVVVIAGCGRESSGQTVATTFDGFAGLTAAAIHVRSGNRSADGCVWVADDDPERERGLMGATDLAGKDAMAFRWPGSQGGSFYMFRTLIELDVAFLDESGTVAEIVPMVPCPADDAALCPRYRAARPYHDAIEIPHGHATDLAIVQGSVVEFGSAC